jgi:hypothetical protein
MPDRIVVANMATTHGGCLAPSPQGAAEEQDLFDALIAKAWTEVQGGVHVHVLRIDVMRTHRPCHTTHYHAHSPRTATTLSHPPPCN